MRHACRVTCAASPLPSPCASCCTVEPWCSNGSRCGGVRRVARSSPGARTAHVVTHTATPFSPLGCVGCPSQCVCSACVVVVEKYTSGTPSRAVPAQSRPSRPVPEIGGSVPDLQLFSQFSSRPTTWTRPIRRSKTRTLSTMELAILCHSSELEPLRQRLDAKDVAFRLALPNAVALRWTRARRTRTPSCFIPTGDARRDNAPRHRGPACG